MDEQKRASLETWTKVAGGWERRRAELRAVVEHIGEWLVAKLGPLDGRLVLDIAAGTGETSMLAARSCERVLATDFSPAMVEAARRGAEAEGLKNIDFSVMDAEQMHLPDACVDAAVCRFGYMLMPDPLAALRETRRVLRPGGRLTFAVWGPPERNPWIAIPAMVMFARGLLPAMDPTAPGGVFSLAAEDRIRELVRDAGFGDPEIEELPAPMRSQTFELMWDLLADTAGPIALAIRSLEPDTAEQVKGEFRAAAESFRAGEGYEIPGVAVGVATAGTGGMGGRSES